MVSGPKKLVFFAKKTNGWQDPPLKNKSFIFCFFCTLACSIHVSIALWGDSDLKPGSMWKWALWVSGQYHYLALELEAENLTPRPNTLSVLPYPKLPPLTLLGNILPHTLIQRQRPPGLKYIQEVNIIYYDIF